MIHWTEGTERVTFFKPQTQYSDTEKTKLHTHTHTQLFYSLPSGCIVQTAGCVLDGLLASWGETNEDTNTYSTSSLPAGWELQLTCSV